MEITGTKVYWNEMTEDGPTIESLEISEAIARMRHSAAIKGFFYPDDKTALEDFLAIYWGWIQ